MALETAKAVARRMHDARFSNRYYVGEGIDIGSGSDSLAHYGSLFGGCWSVRSWDKKDGDAALMEGVADNTYNFVNSSHCLEHLEDPDVALYNWIRITKSGGHLIIVVPDWQLYEKGQWPSEANSDHKHRFTIGWPHDRPGLISLAELLHNRTDVDVLKIELLDQCFFYDQPPWPDQSAIPCTEPAIEIILRKP